MLVHSGYEWARSCARAFMRARARLLWDTCEPAFSVHTHEYAHVHVCNGIG